MNERYPFSSSPIGWFRVALSDELAPGRVVPLAYFGRALVLFRGTDGAARVLDAHCPHLGAHLGYGGVVEGSSIRCPFHGWCFSGEGACEQIPYANKIPPAARLASWPVIERNGLVMVWHHPSGAAPSWDIPRLDELGASEWTALTRRRWKIKTNIHEMVENSFDSAHFRYLHGLHRIPTPDLSFEGASYRIHTQTVMDTPFGAAIEGTLDIHSLGFGFGVVRFTGLIETLLVTAITPIDDDHVDALFSFAVKKLPDESATAMVGTGFIDELSRQVEQDIPIWENKVFLERPLLCEGDGPIGHFRKWARQFYAPSAPRSRTQHALRVTT